MLVQQLLPAVQQRLAALPADASLAQAAKLLSLQHISLVVICSVAKCDGTTNPCTLAVAEAMTRDVLTCRIDEQLDAAWKKMSARSLRHLPILDRAGKPVGVLYARDALKGLLEEVQHDDILIRDYILGAYH